MEQVDRQRLENALRYMAKEKLTQQFVDNERAQREAKWEARAKQEEEQEKRQRMNDAYSNVLKDLRKKGVNTDSVEKAYAESAMVDTYGAAQHLWNDSFLSQLFGARMKDLEELRKEAELNSAANADANDGTYVVQKEKDTATGEETTSPAVPVEDTADYVEYTYQPGDTFGQVVKKLGLESGNGLWGDNGDVEYYSKQLEDQLWKNGVWSQGVRQNIPVGTTIRLRKRALTPEMQAYYNQYGYTN